MRRVIVIGAHGFFGHLATLRLREAGLEPVRASRHAVVSELQVDADDPGSIRSALQAGDIVLDAAGPFQTRTTALVEAATEVGFDFVDLSDSFAHAARILALRDRINRSGVRVLTGCSAVSAVSAALIRTTGLLKPTRASVFLAPAAKDTANPGTARSFLASLRRPLVVRTFAWPGRGRPARGYLTESADARLLPEIWPTLREVDFWVDPQIPIVDALLRIGARLPAGAALARLLRPVGSIVARRLGSSAGAFGVEVESPDGAVARCLLAAASESYLIAIAPAVLAVQALAAGRFPHTGLVRADQQVEPQELLSYLARLGIGLHQSRDL